MALIDYSAQAELVEQGQQTDYEDWIEMPFAVAAFAAASTALVAEDTLAAGEPFLVASWLLVASSIVVACIVAPSLVAVALALPSFAVVEMDQIHQTHFAAQFVEFPSFQKSRLYLLVVYYAG